MSGQPKKSPHALPIPQPRSERCWPGNGTCHNWGTRKLSLFFSCSWRRQRKATQWCPPSDSRQDHTWMHQCILRGWERLTWSRFPARPMPITYLSEWSKAAQWKSHHTDPSTPAEGWYGLVDQPRESPLRTLLKKLALAPGTKRCRR